jgi:thymidylate synthase
MSKQINAEYINTLTDIMKYPQFECAPRGLKIFEKINHTFNVDMDCPIITRKGRNLNYRFMFGEAAWMLDGRNDLKTIRYYMEGIKRFSDDGITFYGAYGPKIVTQLSYIIETLKNDLDTRQAVLNIWRENPRSSKDVPCTLSMQFLVREFENQKYLHCITNMRSNDIWLGTPYDSFNFSAITFYVACRLYALGIKVKLGGLKINAGSRHLYESNWDAAEICRGDFREEECWFSFNDLIERYAGKEDLFIANLYKAGDAKKMTLENRLLELKDVQ